MIIKPIAGSLLPSVFLVALAVVLTLPVARAAEAEKTVVISANDTLRFSVTKITANPGQALHVQLRNQGTLPKAVMGYNWILLDLDIKASAYVMAAASAAAEHYEPKALAAHVLASIPLLGPKESGDVTFNAPSKPGKYPFLCSFPAHFQAGMRGVLIVK
jgi:azurin